MAAEQNRPQLSYIMMEKIVAEGAEAVQEWMGYDDSEWVSFVKGHALAIFCYENPGVSKALGYQSKAAGDYSTGGKWD